MFLSLWVSFECTFVGEWKERVLLCVCEWVHPLCESRSWGTEELQRTAQLWQAGFSFIVRRLERFASVPAPLIRILGCDSQFSVLNSPVLPSLRCEILLFGFSDSDRFGIAFCSFAVAALPASLPALLRISNVVVYQCFCCLFVVDAGRGVRIFYLFSTHTYTLAHTFPMLPLPRLTTRTREKPFTCVFLMTQNFLVDMPGH